MEQQNPDFIHHIDEAKHQVVACNICGSLLYPTDQGNQEITYHCSSAEARFWDFDRGTTDQLKSKEHWENSRIEKFLKGG